MTRPSLEKAVDRLKDVEDAHEVLVHESTDREKYQRKWGSFVLAVGTAFSVLEQAAKANPRAKGWFDGIKYTRRTDPLLKWMQEARNAEEHQDRRTTKYIETKIILPNAQLSKGEEVVKAEPVTTEVITPDGRRELHVDIRAYFLATVISRNGTVYAPPKTHMGKMINPSPEEVAVLQLEYLRRIFSEADQYL